MKELVILSGKGGTGKTTVAASFAMLAQNAVLADCDVDAADLALVLKPTRSERHSFSNGAVAEIEKSTCTDCGGCMRLCRFDAVTMVRDAQNRASFAVDAMACEGCGVCARFCPHQAITLKPAKRGRWMVSQTRAGTMVHGELLPGADVSGKLVAEVRNFARRQGELEKSDLLIIDGPPGIGCPVHAAVSHASMVLLVTEPTASGRHDLQRIITLIQAFHFAFAVCVNRWDIDGEMSAAICAEASAAGAVFTAKIGFDPAVTDAQIKSRTVVEGEGPAATEIRALWRQTEDFLLREKASC